MIINNKYYLFVYYSSEYYSLREENKYVSLKFVQIKTYCCLNFNTNCVDINKNIIFHFHILL